ncbi:MAG TPA: TauD/TfdA family dioxygenase [Thermoanaerobaculia bacterium]|jgi:alpha-ketoglutarate-dependent taurine dioxygenase
MPSIKTSSPGSLGGLRRRSMLDGQQEWVREEPLFADGGLPVVFRPAIAGVDLSSWARDHRQRLDECLLRHGGILLRGFDLPNVEQFADLIAAVAGDPLPYDDRTAPRSAVHGNIYTSTDLPADRVVLLHNESSYSHVWPRRIFFQCVLPAREGGETPIADSRRLYSRLAPDLRRRFEDLGVMYVRNYGDGLGLSWQEVFQTDDPARVEAFCRQARIEFEWKDDTRLRTRQVRPGVVRHPTTGEPVWFNQALVFHVAMQPPEVREVLLSTFAEEDLPTQSYYGDGTSIPDEVVRAVDEAHRAETRIFQWAQGDVLLLDNFLAAHGRRTFKGPRKVLVGMGGPCTLDDVGFTVN